MMKLIKEQIKLLDKYKIEKPIEVLHEGVDLSTYLKPKTDVDVLEGIDTDFNFLVCGHWLKGDLGHDRKDIGMTIQTFCTVFENVPKKQQQLNSKNIYGRILSYR